MSTTDHLKVTAYLSSPLAGHAPILDAVLEWAVSLHHHRGNDHRWKVDRGSAAPEVGVLPIPINRQAFGGWLVACCSSAILPPESNATTEHITKRIAVEHSNLLRPEARKQVNTTGGWTKSYRLPLLIRPVEKVVWFAQGNRRGVLSLLKQVRAIGAKVSDGYGKVVKWEVEKDVNPAWWFGDSGEGHKILMRPLPLCSELPIGLIGFRKSFGACCAPYWHQDRFCEIVEPV